MTFNRLTTALLYATCALAFAYLLMQALMEKL
jgi:hypothetical protein